MDDDFSSSLLFPTVGGAKDYVVQVWTLSVKHKVKFKSRKLSRDLSLGTNQGVGRVDCGSLRQSLNKSSDVPLLLLLNPKRDGRCPVR